MTDQEMLWEYGGDILRSPTMAREREIPQHGSTTCFDHSVAVGALQYPSGPKMGLGRGLAQSGSRCAAPRLFFV